MNHEPSHAPISHYDDLVVLIPCHSLEDFPTELGEEAAAGLLNGFTVLWHPVLLAACTRAPRWERADDMIEMSSQRLVILPTASEEMVPSRWIERARRDGIVVVKGTADREAMISEMLAPLAEKPEVDPDLVADFLALGHLNLQTELLSRHMRHFGDIDVPQLEREAIAGAKAAIAQDTTAARTHLRHCFEMLLEARERFYPVDCYLMELCLVIPRLAGEDLHKLLQQDTPTNLMLKAEDLQAIAEQDPSLMPPLRSRLEQESLDLVGGELSETCTPLLSLESILWQLEQGRRVHIDQVGQPPTTWGRRRYGVGPHMPGLLSRFGFQSALHFVMDDGIYPDEEYAKLRWQGCDGSAIDAYSRIPLAADSATGFLRFPARMSESMDNDHVAGIIFARWPQMQTPWLEDFRRAHKYAPVLGQFVTFATFFSETDLDGRMSEFRHGTMLTPFLVQSVAAREPSPVTRYVTYWRRRRLFESADWCQRLANFLQQGDLSAAKVESLRADLERAGPDIPNESDSPSVEKIDQRLETFRNESLQTLSQGLLQASAPHKGLLIVNPLSFSRTVPLEWPEDWTSLPPGEKPVVSRQVEPSPRRITVELPPCGYVWLDGQTTASPPAPAKVPLAEELLVRNEFFEVTLSEATGGIAQLRTYGRGPSRLSQQIAWRFPREKTVPLSPDSHEVTKTWYSRMQLREAEILSDGPTLGAVQTVGDLIDPSTEQTLGTFRQVVRAWRGREILDLEIELDLEHQPEGDPWTNYVACRFAWSDETMTLTRSLHESAHQVQSEQRIESPSFLEIANENWRTTILTGGLTFHRKTGPRMLDTLLVTEGEQERTFRCGIVVDHGFPMQAALDFESPPLCLPVEQGPPAAGAVASLFGVSAKNVQLRGILPLRSGSPEGSGCLIRLQETEGRRKTFRLGCFRTPRHAQQVDFLGSTINELPIEEGFVIVEIAPHELCDVELRFT